MVKWNLNNAQKMKVIIHISKLQAILLLETDLNRLHKIMFSSRLLPSFEYRNEILYEIIGGRRSQLAYHITLNKILISNNRNIRK